VSEELQTTHCKRKKKQRVSDYVLLDVGLTSLELLIAAVVCVVEIPVLRVAKCN